MTKALFAFGVAAVALTVAAPADARRTGPVHRANGVTGTASLGGPATTSDTHSAPAIATPISAHCQGPIVTRTGAQHYRYVNENGYVYVVNPRNYRVVRVIPTN